MSHHFRTELDRLRRKLLSLAALVEDRLRTAVRSIEFRDVETAERVIEGDEDIDRLEVELEEDCLKILALYQPVAGDLRFLITVLKINNDLERIGDLAVNIAERGVFLATHPASSFCLDFTDMAEKARSMLKKGLDALVERNAALAREVISEDDEVDALNRRVFLIIQEAIRTHPSVPELLLHYLSTSRHLERVADHATNIAEDVVYMLEGEIIRHQPEDYRRKPVT